jgi:hypothetical protein
MLTLWHLVRFLIMCVAVTSSAFIVVPGDDVAGEVVEDRREVEPSPANDLEISEVRLPELIWCRRLILELVRGFHHDEG